MKNTTEKVLFHPQLNIDIERWHYKVPLIDNSPDPPFGRDYMPKFVMYVTHYYAYEQWCKDNFKDVETTRCLSAFLHYKKNANNFYGKVGLAKDTDFIKESDVDR